MGLRDKHLVKSLPEQKAALVWDYDRFVVHEYQVPSHEARLAVDIAKHLAFCTAMPTGELDKEGRDRLRLMTPAEVASRACSISSELMTEFGKRNWIIELPIEEQLKAYEEESKAKEK